MKKDVDLLTSKNVSLITKVNMLKEALHIAKSQNAKWFTSHKNLNLLLAQKPNGRASLGFVDSKTKQKEPGTTHKEPVSKVVPRDTSWIKHYKRRKYVCMPELDVCFFCGDNGHEMYNCMKKKKTYVK